jgi:hypothetical protein
MGGSGSSTARTANEFDGYRLAAGSSGRSSQYPNDPNQPPLTALINRVNIFLFI